MKKLLALAIGLTTSLVVVMAFNPRVSFVHYDGYMMPENHISSDLSSGNAEPVILVEVEPEDLIYSSFLNDYIYESNTKIDLDYPLYSNDGRTIQFYNQDFSIVSNEMNILESYDGLFINDGHTYNQDLAMADSDEFILIPLANGLHIIVQDAVFTNKLESVNIPSNSIVKFEEDSVKFYAYQDDALLYTGVEQTFDATLAIGDNVYEYAKFLEALGLISQTIENQNEGLDIEELQEEILQTLNPNKTNPQGQKDTEELESGNLEDEKDNKDSSEELNEDDDDKKVESDLDVSKGDNTEENENKTPSEDGDQTLGEEGSDKTEDDNGSGDNSGEDEGGTELPSDPSAPTGPPGDGGEAPPYQKPEITLDNFSSWAYAINGDLDIKDQSGTLKRGISIAAYKKIKGDMVQKGTINGYKVYDGNEGKGSSTALRKTFYSSQNITLNVLPPDTVMYLQLTYTYAAEDKMIVDGEEITYYTRKTEKSDFYEIKTKSIQDSNLTNVKLDYETVFAAYPNRLMLDNITLKNDSNYDPTIKDFDNFQLNLLPYVSRITMDFEPEDDILINSSIIKAAQQANGAHFTSSTGSLTSNNKHDYKLIAYDKYGNKLPLLVNSQDATNYQTSLYTSKATPEITIIESDNITDSITLEVKVTDKDNALINNNSLKLYILDREGQFATLSGTWDDKTTFGENSPLTCLELEDAKDGKTYKFTLGSLAFAKSYNIQIFGDYAPQPDSVTDPNLQLPIKSNELLVEESIFTAPITAGSLLVNTSILKTTDTGATISLGLDEQSTIDVLPLIDEIRLSFTDKENNQVKQSYVLKENVLNKIFMGDKEYPYNESTESVTIYKDPYMIVELNGLKEQFLGKTLWESMMIEAMDDGSGEVTYSVPTKLRITLIDGQLETSTLHNIDYEAVVIKSGIEYNVASRLTNSTFRTKKLSPIILPFDIFTAGDVLQFINYGIDDPDNTILGNGFVNLQLCQKDAILDVKSINANTNPQIVEFSGLTAGIEYTIKVVAREYNNDTGYANYKANYLLDEYKIIAGSDITANITINNLDYQYEELVDKNIKNIVNLSGAQVAEGLDNADSNDWHVGYSSYPNSFSTEFFPVSDLTKDGYNVLLMDYYPNTASGVYDHRIIQLFDRNKRHLKNSYAYNNYNGKTTVFLPDNTAYVRLVLPNIEFAKKWGLKIDATKIQDEDIIIKVNPNQSTDTNKYPFVLENIYATSDVNNDVLSPHSSIRSIYHMPVNPGEIYFAGGNTAGNIIYHNEAKDIVGYQTTRRNTSFTIPKDAKYLSMSFHKSEELTLYRLADTPLDNAYHLDSDVEVSDVKGYLLDSSGNSTAKLRIEYSPSIKLPEYSVVEEINIDLTKASSTDPYKGAMEYINDHLTPYSSYRLSVVAVYNNNEIELDSIELNTDGPYIIVNTAEDLRKMNSYPSANFLVMNDIAVDFMINTPFKGTIDFNGHTLTKLDTNHMFHTLDKQATIKNLVYEITNPEMERAMIANSFGTIQNIFIKTTTKINADNVGFALLVNIQRDGVIENFVVELGGDLELSNRESAILVRYARNTLVQNGYIYSVNGSDVVLKTTDERMGGLFYESPSGFEARNIYSAYDTYMPIDVASSSGFTYTSKTYSRMLTDYYHLGDFYIYDNGKTNNLMSKRRIFSSGYNAQNLNLWHVTQTEYHPFDAQDNINTTAISTLHDVTWQDSVIGKGDAFDIEKSVTMGFYPRLNWPVCMQQHQLYRNLPLVEKSKVPVIVDDHVYPDTILEMDRGKIVLSMENTGGYSIDSVDIEGLNTIVVDQGLQNDGLYDVVLSVSVSKDEMLQAYLSKYKVTNIQFVNSGSKVNIPSEYITKNIKFYKAIKTTQDWTNINLHMDWNYRIDLGKGVDYLDFEKDKVSIGATMINGSTTSMTATSQFSGTIDGGKYDDQGNLIGYYTLKGMTLENVDRPFVFYYLTATAEIKNLIIEDMSLVGKANQTSSESGFIRYAYPGSSLENIHIIDSNINASGKIGALISINHATILNSSVVDTTITLKSPKFEVYIGGLVAQSEYGATIANSYTRNVDIVANKVNSVYGIGGLVGRSYATKINNCYTHGSIISDGYYIGGLVGSFNYYSSGLENSYSYVNINTIGSNVGGAVGFLDTESLDSVLVVGDIFAGSSNTHRIVGRELILNYNKKNYAYKGQIMNSLSDTDSDGASALLDGEQLRKLNTWTDTINFVDSWDYTSLKANAFPLLYQFGSDELVYGQENIKIPGEDSLSISVESADIINKQYVSSIKITSQGKTFEEIKTAIENKTLTFTIEGMAMTDADYKDDKYTYEIKQFGNEEAVNLIITNNVFTHAYDTYKIKVTYDTTTVTQVIDYGESLYHDVPDLTTWNLLMINGHDRTSENFKITGNIDFENRHPDYTNLIINKLVGNSDDAAFSNISYASSSDQAGGWISTVSSVEGIDFNNIKLSYMQLPNYQQRGGLILLCTEYFKDSIIENIIIDYNTIYLGGASFIYDLQAEATNINLSNINITSYGKTGRGESIGGLASLSNSQFNNIDANNININTPYNDFAGGIFGKVDSPMTSQTDFSKNNHVKDVTIHAKLYGGGMAGYLIRLTLKDSSVENAYIKIDSTYSVYAGGMFGRYSTYVSINDPNLSVKNSEIIGKTSHETYNCNVGGLFGEAHALYTIGNMKVENVRVSSSKAAGGIAGITSHSRYSNCEVINSSIYQHDENGYNKTEVIGAGGFFGNLANSVNNYRSSNNVVRDTEIVADKNAGGFAGTIRLVNDKYSINNIYIAEDVNVTAIDKNAGGLFGSAANYNITGDIAIGADVTSLGYSAGGVIGEVLTKDPEGLDLRLIQGVYVSGDVTAMEYAGGIYGFYQEDNTLTENELKGVIVSNNVLAQEKAHPIVHLADDKYYETGNVWIYENSLLNGQVVKDVVASDSLLIGSYVDSNRFKEVDFYTNALMKDIDTSHFSNSGNPYMPYIKNSTDKTIINNTKTYKEKDVGILLPTGGVSNEATVVYTSGIDSINIESTKSSVMVDGTEITFEDNDKHGDKYHVITIGYDFTSNIEIDGVTYQPTDFIRDIMTYGNYWYYVDGSKLMYGTTTPVEMIIVGEPLHLWQGKVLSKDGKVYDLTNNPVTEVSSILTHKDIVDIARPLFAYLNGLNTYHNFSVYGDNVLDYRILQSKGNEYPVFTTQNMKYDSFILHTSDSNKYLAMMNQDTNEITNYLSTLKLGDFRLENIKNLSNSYGYDRSMIIARYNDGTVSILDYIKGTVISPNPPSNGILGYGINMINGFANSLFGNNVATNDSLFYSSELMNTYNQSYGIKAPGNAQSTVGGVLNQSTLTQATASLIKDLPAQANYVVGDGLYAENQNDLLIEGTKYVNNEGVYVNNELIYTPAKTTIENTTLGSIIEVNKVTTKNETVHESKEEVQIAYNPYSYSYELFSKEEVKTETMHQSIVNKEIEQLVQSDIIEENKERNSKFNISEIISELLEVKEKDSLSILTIMAIFVSIVFGAFYIRMKKVN